MHIENPIAYSFIMQDDIYLLNNDKTAFADKEALRPIAPACAREPVIEVAPPQPITKTEPVSFNYLGKNKKHLLIIVHYAEPEFIAEKYLTALESILGRLSFSLDDAAIFNRAKYDTATFNELTDFFKPQKLLVLGKYALPPGLDTLVLNQPKQINNFNALFSFSFDEMMDSNELKKAFWDQMKQL